MLGGLVTTFSSVSGVATLELCIHLDLPSFGDGEEGKATTTATRITVGTSLSVQRYRRCYPISTRLNGDSQ